MALICLVTLEMTDPSGNRRLWRGLPETRDWEGLEAAKKCDGWKTVTHRRDFVEKQDVQETRDSVVFSGA